MPASWFYTVSLTVRFTRFKRRNAGVGSSLRVCGLVSFTSCDDGCPSLRRVCVQIGGEERQNERGGDNVYEGVCPRLPVLAFQVPKVPPHTHTNHLNGLAAVWRGNDLYREGCVGGGGIVNCNYPFT